MSDDVSSRQGTKRVSQDGPVAAIWCEFISGEQFDEMRNLGLVEQYHEEALEENGFFRLPASGGYDVVSFDVNDEKAPESLETALEKVVV